MADTIDPTAPDFDRVQREAGSATRDGMALTWLDLQEEKRQRQVADRTMESAVPWTTLADAWGDS